MINCLGMVWLWGWAPRNLHGGDYLREPTLMLVRLVTKMQIDRKLIHYWFLNPGVYREYSKAAGAVTCTGASQGVTEQECSLAGMLVGHPFNKAVADATGRPGGCFWDQNGDSYFNTVLDRSPA